MCVVSFIGDSFKDRYAPRFPDWWPNGVPDKDKNPVRPFELPLPQVTREEFNQLKKEIEILKDLWKRAKEYDEKTGQPDCEIEDKVALLKLIAKAVGVDLEDIVK